VDPEVMIVTNKTIVTSNVIPLATSNTTGTTGITLQAPNFSNVVSTTRTQYNDGTPQNFTGTGASAATYITPATMGTGRYIYTTAAVSAVYFIMAIDFTTVPSSNSVISISSSSSIFTPAAASTWLAGATTKTYQLKNLTGKTPYNYIYKTDQVFTNPNGGPLRSQTIYYANTYYVPFDTVAPIFTSTFNGVGIASEDTVNMPKNTALSDFIKYNTVNTYLNIKTDDAGATITESNTIVNTVVGNYTITFVATDTNLNSRTLNLYVAVVP
jgi:hypothetical protein